MAVFSHFLPPFSAQPEFLQVGGFPFDARQNPPNKETLAAILEAERIAHDPSVNRCSDVEEALRELKR